MQSSLKEVDAPACVKLLKSLNYRISEEEHSSLCDGLTGLYSFGWHIFGLFVILISSLIGVFLPLIITHVACLSRNPYIFAFSKAMATGVLLSASMIHLINEGAHMFLEPCVGAWVSSYKAYAFLFALIAALLMQALDIELATIAERWIRRNKANKSHNTISQNPHDQLTQPYLSSNSPSRCKDENLLGSSPTEVPLVLKNTCEHARNDDCHGHQHFFEMSQDMGMARKVISAICMEFGVALHSIFVGIVVGLTTDDELSPLLIALFFHQMFEGMSLGSRLVDAKFRGALEIILAAIFTLSAPFGMALSISVVKVSRDAMSGSTFVETIAVLESFCGGILLYLAFTLLLFDFPEDLRKFCADGMPGRVKRKLGLFFALWFGMGLMAFVGKSL
ncbi:unnamed protein product [Phytomonas sp. EM1]|nr:unnamed protein product [Phytomonas sp. EM1]|eukprot:CCW65727.1 unnamed protein product [Phytomonas sp. isolate EM1]